MSGSFANVRRQLIITSSTSHSICTPRCGGILRHGYTEQFLGVSVRDKMLKIHPQLPNLWLKMKRLALYASRLHRVGASETTYWSVTYDFLLTFHTNHGPISYSFRDKRWFQWICGHTPSVAAACRHVSSQPLVLEACMEMGLAGILRVSRGVPAGFLPCTRESPQGLV